MLEFSFSGLRSATERYVQRLVKAEGDLSPLAKADVANSFQHAAAAHIEDKLRLVLDKLEVKPSALVCSGGVASNNFLRARLQTLPFDRLLFPPLSLCTDNAAMIAFVGSERLKRGSVDESYENNFLPKWSVFPDAKMNEEQSLRQ